MTSQRIKTTVKYLGGTYTGEIEPYVKNTDGKSPDDISPDDSSSANASVGVETKISELIQLMHEYNSNDTAIKSKLGKCALTIAAGTSSLTTVANQFNDEECNNITQQILQQLEALISNQQEKINKMKVIFKVLNIPDQNEYMINNETMLARHNERKNALNKKDETGVAKGGNTTFNKRRHSRHLMPSLKKRKHSTTRRKHK